MLLGASLDGGFTPASAEFHVETVVRRAVEVALGDSEFRIPIVDEREFFRNFTIVERNIAKVNEGRCLKTTKIQVVAIRMLGDLRWRC